METSKSGVKLSVSIVGEISIGPAMNRLLAESTGTNEEATGVEGTSSSQFSGDFLDFNGSLRGFEFHPLRHMAFCPECG